MFSYFALQGHSMEPFANEGDFVFAERLSYLLSAPKVGHVVVVKHPQNSGKLLVKRIIEERKGRYWLQGDNTEKSTDSRHFGWVGKEYIVGRVIIKAGNPHHSKMSVGTPKLLAKSAGGVIHKTRFFGHSILL
jgi:nickel-type superoxide dismutase maturation protease